MAAERGKELNLICLQRDMDDAYLKELAAFVKAKGLTSSTADLSMSAQLGVLPFIQDWFAGDPDITRKAAVFGVVIGTVSCHEGFETKLGAVGVGRATQRSVIISFLLILMFGYMITRLFYFDF